MTRRHTIDARRVYFDLETGGTDETRHPIIQIGAVTIGTDGREVERFEVKVKFDEADCDAEALRKARYDRRLWNLHGVEPMTAFERFCYFLREHATIEKLSRKKRVPYHLARLVAHNASFDSRFLSNWHATLKDENSELFLPADRLVICTMQAALKFFDEHSSLTPPSDYKLGTLCEYFRIPFSTNEAHDGLYDALATAKLDQAIQRARNQLSQQPRRKSPWPKQKNAKSSPFRPRVRFANSVDAA